MIWSDYCIVALTLLSVVVIYKSITHKVADKDKCWYSQGSMLG